MTRQKEGGRRIFNGQPEKIRDRTDMEKQIRSVIRFQEAAKAGNGSDPLRRDTDRRPKDPAVNDRWTWYRIDKSSDYQYGPQCKFFNIDCLEPSMKASNESEARQQNIKMSRRYNAGGFFVFPIHTPRSGSGPGLP